MNASTKRALWIGGTLLVVAALAAPKIFSSDQQGAPPPGAAGPQLVTVEVAEANTVRDVLTATGTLQAFEEIELRSEVSGRVTAVQFTEGSRVRAGQLIVKIFDDDLQAQLRSAESERELAALQQQRQQQLLNEGGTSQQALDEAANRLRTTEARIEELKAQIDRTQIRAPFAGTIGLRQISLGAFLSPGDPIAVLQMLDPLKIDFSVPERQAPRVQVGSTMLFTVQGFSERFEGEVYASDPGIDETTRTLRFRARTDNPDRRLRPGAFARVEVVVDESEDAVMVPTVSVVTNGEAKTVYVVEGGVAQPRSVQTGIRTEQRVQVTEGVAPGDSIITSGIQNMRPDLPVRVDTSRDAFSPDSVEPSGAGVSVREPVGASSTEPETDEASTSQ